MMKDVPAYVCERVVWFCVNLNRVILILWEYAGLQASWGMIAKRFVDIIRFHGAV